MTVVALNPDPGLLTPRVTPDELISSASLRCRCIAPLRSSGVKTM